MFLVSDLVLNRFFTRSTFQGLLVGKEQHLFEAAMQHCRINPTGKNNETIINEMYSYLRRYYHNEYYYKNTLLNILLMGRHKPSTTTALTEVPVGKAKADFVLINGKATVYEIKTELDNLERLEHQINEYYKAFRYVVVVTYPENFLAIEQRISNPAVGIYVITSRGTISQRLVREPQEYTELLDIDTIFRVLRKPEYEEILVNTMGKLPITTSFKYYKACEAQFCEALSVIRAQNEMEKLLKRRIRIDTKAFSSIPKSLRFLAYFSEMHAADYQQVRIFLNSSSEEETACISQF